MPEKTTNIWPTHATITTAYLAIANHIEEETFEVRKTPFTKNRSM